MVIDGAPTKYLKTTWATLLLYFSPIFFISSSNRKLGLFSAGIGRPSGQYAVTTMLRSLQNLINCF